MAHPQHCPGCGNRCSLDAPSCTTGERYARSLRAAHHRPAPAEEASSAPPAPEAAPKRHASAQDAPRKAAKAKAKVNAAPAPIPAELPLEEHLSLQLRALERTLERNQPSQKSGQSRLLSLLAEQPGHQLTQRELMGRMGIRSSSLSELVRKLEQAGLIQRSACPTDRRTALIALTEQGAAKAAALPPASAHPFQALSEAEQQTLLALLVKLNQAER